MNKINYKKFSVEQQRQFCYLIAELLKNGFSVQEAVLFTQKINRFPNAQLVNLGKKLSAGLLFSISVDELGFQQQHQVQLRLAEQHGNLIQTLYGISNHLSFVEKRRKRVKKLVSYPIFLLLFLIGVFLSMQFLLLPQLISSGMIQEFHWSIIIVQNFHRILFICLILLLLGYRMIHTVRAKTCQLVRATWKSRIPGIGRSYRLYQSAFIALEIGKLLSEGLELKQTIYCLQQMDSQSIVHLVAKEIAEGSLNGISLNKQLTNFSFLTDELIVIIQQGEAKGKLGKELLLYSETASEEYFQYISKWLGYIQPAMFLLIALLIIMVYAALLLPIYSNMEGIV